MVDVQKNLEVDFLGAREISILSYISNHNGKSINKSSMGRKSSSDYVGVHRTTIIGIIQRLINKGLVTNPSTTVYSITSKAKEVLSNYKFANKSGRVPAKRNQLSTHKAQYKLSIYDNSKYYFARLKELNPISIEEHHHKNFSYQKIVTFDDAKIVINKKSVMINIYDSVDSDSALDSSYETFLRVVDYAEKLKGIGLMSSQISVHDSHYARVDSLFANYLYKIDDKFQIELDDGTKYWVDRSLGVPEEESNSPDAADNARDAMRAIVSGKANLNNLPFLESSIKALTTVNAQNTDSLVFISKQIIDLNSAIGRVVEQNENTASGLKAVVDILKNNVLNNSSPVGCELSEDFQDCYYVG